MMIAFMTTMACLNGYFTFYGDFPRVSAFLCGTSVMLVIWLILDERVERTK